MTDPNTATTSPQLDKARGRATQTAARLADADAVKGHAQAETRSLENKLACATLRVAGAMRDEAALSEALAEQIAHEAEKDRTLLSARLEDEEAQRYLTEALEQDRLETAKAKRDAGPSLEDRVGAVLRASMSLQTLTVTLPSNLDPSDLLDRLQAFTRELTDEALREATDGSDWSCALDMSGLDETRDDVTDATYAAIEDMTQEAENTASVGTPKERA